MRMKKNPNITKRNLKNMKLRNMNMKSMKNMKRNQKNMLMNLKSMLMNLKSMNQKNTIMMSMHQKLSHIYLKIMNHIHQKRLATILQKNMNHCGEITIGN